MKKILTIITILLTIIVPINIKADGEEKVNFALYGSDSECYEFSIGPDYIFGLDGLTGFTYDETKGIKVVSLTDSNDYSHSEYDDNGNQFQARFVYDDLMVGAEPNVAEGKYYIEIYDASSQAKRCYINVSKNGGGTDQNNGVFEYQGKQYQVGPANGSTDGQTLHIEMNGNIELNSNNKSWGFFVGVGKIVGGNLSGTATDILDSVLNTLTVSFDKENILEFVKNGETYHFNDKTITGGTGIDTKYYEVKLKNGADPEDVNIVMSFTLGGDEHTICIPINYSSTVHMNFNEDDLNSIEGDTVVDKLNRIFVTRDSFSSFITSKGKELNNDSDITFELKPSTTYNGVIVFNCKNNDDQFRLTLKTSSFDEQQIGNMLNIEEKLYTYNSTNTNAKIVGGILNKAGLNKIEGIDFVGSDSYKQSFNNSSYKIGILVDGATYPSVRNSINEIYGCKFSGYDYAVVSNGYGLISGETGCLFEDNKIAKYINCTGFDSYSDTLKSTFVDNEIAAIQIDKLPSNLNSNQFVISNNYFFENAKDFIIGDNVEGTFFFIENFYGETYEDKFINDNVLSAKNSYVARDNFTLVSNPCIRYPENECIMGIDENSVTKFVNGQAYELHTKDIIDRSKEIEIGIYNDDEGKDNGRLVFGGNN